MQRRRQRIVFRFPLSRVHKLADSDRKVVVGIANHRRFGLEFSIRTSLSASRDRNSDSDFRRKQILPVENRNRPSGVLQFDALAVKLSQKTLERIVADRHSAAGLQHRFIQLCVECDQTAQRSGILFMQARIHRVLLPSPPALSKPDHTARSKAESRSTPDSQRLFGNPTEIASRQALGAFVLLDHCKGLPRNSPR